MLWFCAVVVRGRSGRSSRVRRRAGLSEPGVRSHPAGAVRPVSREHGDTAATRPRRPPPPPALARLRRTPRAHAAGPRLRPLRLRPQYTRAGSRAPAPVHTGTVRQGRGKPRDHVVAGRQATGRHVCTRQQRNITLACRQYRCHQIVVVARRRFIHSVVLYIVYWGHTPCPFHEKWLTVKGCCIIVVGFPIPSTTTSGCTVFPTNYWHCAIRDGVLVSKMAAAVWRLK